MIRLDIMDGVDGGCAVGGGPGFVGIPPYLARQAQVSFPGEFIPPALSPRLPDVGSSTSAGMPSAASRMGVEALPGAFPGRGGAGIGENPVKSPI